MVATYLLALLPFTTHVQISKCNLPAGNLPVLFYLFQYIEVIFKVKHQNWG